MATWFTADQHLGHTKIIKICNRPFKLIEDMNEQLIANWNRLVFPNDVIYCLGDMFWTTEAAKYYLPCLNGEIHYIPSFEKSHEKGIISWSDIHSVKNVKIFPPIVEIIIESQRIILCHYALRVWPKSHYGSIHLFGHSHGRLTPIGKSWDVGVDTEYPGIHEKFYPYSWEEIVEIMKHGEKDEQKRA